MLAVLAVVATIGAAACGNDQGGGAPSTSDPATVTSGDIDPSTTSPGDRSDVAFRLAVVSPSVQDDTAFSQSIFDAVNRIARTRSTETAVSDGLDDLDDAEAAIRSYAQEGYNLIVVHGSQYSPVLAEIATDHPDVAFATGLGLVSDLPNTSTYEVRSDEGGFVMGAIAAEITETSKVGIVAPFSGGAAERYVDGFTAGVVARNPAVMVDVIYTGSFADVDLARDAASELVASGADVLTATAQLAVGAVEVANENGIAWFGNQSNQTELARDVVVASQVYRLEVALQQIIDGIEAGVLGGRTYPLTLGNGGMVIEFNDAVALDPAVRALADTISAGIIDGSITTGVE